MFTGLHILLISEGPPKSPRGTAYRYSVVICSQNVPKDLLWKEFQSFGYNLAPEEKGAKMAALTLEERAAALETQIEHLQQRQESDKSSDAPHGWQKIVGIFADTLGFEEAVRFGRAGENFGSLWAAGKAY